MGFKVNGYWEESDNGMITCGTFIVSSFFRDENDKEHYVEADDNENPLSVLVGGWHKPPHELAAKLNVEIVEE
jgi:hypothetical protein